MGRYINTIVLPWKSFLIYSIIYQMQPLLYNLYTDWIIKEISTCAYKLYLECRCLRFKMADCKRLLHICVIVAEPKKKHVDVYHAQSVYYMRKTGKKITKRFSLVWVSFISTPRHVNIMLSASQPNWTPCSFTPCFNRVIQRRD